MIRIVLVNVRSRDRTVRVDAILGRSNCALAGASARARSVERRDRSVGGAHEAVEHVVRVTVHSRNRPRRVDAKSDCVQTAGSLEGGENSVGKQETVLYIVPVTVVSDYRSRLVDAPSEGALVSARASAG